MSSPGSALQSSFWARRSVFFIIVYYCLSAPSQCHVPCDILSVSLPPSKLSLALTNFSVHVVAGFTISALMHLSSSRDTKQMIYFAASKLKHPCGAPTNLYLEKISRPSGRKFVSSSLVSMPTVHVVGQVQLSHYIYPPTWPTNLTDLHTTYNTTLPPTSVLASQRIITPQPLLGLGPPAYSDVFPGLISCFFDKVCPLSMSYPTFTCCRSIEQPSYHPYRSDEVKTARHVHGNSNLNVFTAICSHVLCY